MEFAHTSVLLEETIEGLAIKPDGIYVDGTLGRAGHSLEIVRRLTTGRLIALDRDETAIEAANRRLGDRSGDKAAGAVAGACDAGARQLL